MISKLLQTLHCIFFLLQIQICLHEQYVPDSPWAKLDHRRTWGVGVWVYGGGHFSRSVLLQFPNPLIPMFPSLAVACKHTEHPQFSLEVSDFISFYHPEGKAQADSGPNKAILHIWYIKTVFAEKAFLGSLANLGAIYSCFHLLTWVRVGGLLFKNGNEFHLLPTLGGGGACLVHKDGARLKYGQITSPTHWWEGKAAFFSKKMNVVWVGLVVAAPKVQKMSCVASRPLEVVHRVSRTTILYCICLLI